MGTTIIKGNTQSSKSAQSLHSISTKAASPTRKMKFPITVTYRQLEAKIYRIQIHGVKYYKAAYRAKGGRVTKTFKKLKEAKEAASNGLKEAHQRGELLQHSHLLKACVGDLGFMKPKPPHTSQIRLGEFG